MCEPKFITIHPTIAEIFQCGPKQKQQNKMAKNAAKCPNICFMLSSHSNVAIKRTLKAWMKSYSELQYFKHFELAWRSSLSSKS